MTRNRASRCIAKSKITHCNVRGATFKWNKVFKGAFCVPRGPIDHPDRTVEEGKVMKNLLLGGVAAFAIVASPVSGLAQSTDRGAPSESPRSTESGGSGRAESGSGGSRMESGGSGSERGSSSGAEMRGERGTSSSGAEPRGERPSAADSSKDTPSGRPSAADAPTSRDATERSGGAASSGTKPSTDTKSTSDTKSMERDEKLRERSERSGGARDTSDRPDRERTGGDSSRPSTERSTTTERPSSERSTTTERSTERDRSSSRTSVNISSEKRSTIRETIVSSPSVRKVSRSTIGVDLRVGVSVPRTVTIERLPPRIVEIVPEYADYSYFVLDDGTIVIVDPATYDVVYVIEA